MNVFFPQLAEKHGLHQVVGQLQINRRFTELLKMKIIAWS